MAKFCGSCGAQLDDDAKVCGHCGTPVEEGQTKIPGFKVVDPEKKKKLLKKVKMILVLAVVVVIAIVGLNIVKSYTGSNGLIRKVMSAYENYDIDALVALSSDMYYYSDYDDYVDEYFEYSVGNNIDNFESSVGHSYKMSYEIEEVYDLSQRKQDEILENIEYSFPDFDVDTIDTIVVADVKVTAKQGTKSVSTNVKITMAKEGNSWKLLYLD